MIGRYHPLRLLRKTWDDTSELAQELFEMLAATEEPKVVQGPVTIVAPKDQPALVITRPEPPPVPGAWARSMNRVVKAEADRVQRNILANREEDQRVRADALRGRSQRVSAQGNLAGSEQQRPADRRDLPALHGRDIPGRLPRDHRENLGRPRDLPQPRTRDDVGADRGQLHRGSGSPGTEGPEVRGVVAGDHETISREPDASALPLNPSFTQAPPYRVPLVEIEGPVVFSGKTPVQLDLSPLVFNPITAEFESVSHLADLAHIPREHEKVTSDWMFGIIKDALGNAVRYESNVATVAETLYFFHYDTEAENEAHDDNHVLHVPTFWSLEGRYQVQSYPDGPHGAPGDLIEVKILTNPDYPQPGPDGIATMPDGGRFKVGYFQHPRYVYWVGPIFQAADDKYYLDWRYNYGTNVSYSRRHATFWHT